MKAMSTARLRHAALILGFVVAAGGASAKVTPSVRCEVAKLAAAKRKTAAELRCFEKALLAKRSVDTACLAFASAHFAKAFERAEQKGGCTTTGDAATVEAEVDAYVATLTGTPVSGSTTSTMVTTTSILTTTTMACGAVGLSCGGFCPGGHACAMDPKLLFCVCGP